MGVRVFRFGDDAYQATSDMVRMWGKLYQIGDGARWIPTHATDSRLTSAEEPARLSSWEEWFDLTISNAAHQYLLHALTFSRMLVDVAEDPDDTVRTAAIDRSLRADKALLMISAAFGERSIRVFDPAEIDPYMVRVRRDLESRLRGEEGSIPPP